MQNLSLHCTVLVPQPGIEPTAPALQGRFLPTGPPAKSLCPLTASYLHMQLAYYHYFAPFSTFMGSRISQVAQWSTCKYRRCRRHGINTWVGKIPLEEEMATHCSVLVWRIPWTQEPRGLESMGSQRVRHDPAHTLRISNP